MTSDELLADFVPPRFRWAPEYDFTLGPDVADLCAAAGYAPDPEQRIVLADVFAEKQDDLPAIFASVVIGARQNIKTGVELQSGIGWVYVIEAPKVQYSAHKWRTARETFETAQQIIGSSEDLSRQVLRYEMGSGYRLIHFKQDRKWLFTTRTNEGDRGTGWDKQILDEGFALRPSHMGSILPVMSTRPLAQLVIGSSAGKPQSDVLREFRDRGRAGGDQSLSYNEWCALDPVEACDLGEACDHRRTTPGCGCDKPRIVQMANSQMGRRITREYIMVNERSNLTASEFARERMGWWDDPINVVEAPPIDVDLWRDLEEDEPAVPETIDAFGVEVDLDQAFASLGAAALDEAGRTFVELLPPTRGGVPGPGRGTGWVVERCVEIDRDQGPGAWAVDGGGPAAHLIPKLEEAGLYVLTLAAKDVVSACARMVNLVNDSELVHGPQSQLDAAVEGAKKRPLGDGGFTFGRRKSDVDVTPLLAVTLAAWAMEQEAGPNLW